MSTSRFHALSLFTAGVLATPLGAQHAAQQAASRFQKNIDAFLAADSTSRPAAGGIEFIGSSIFRFWTTVAKDMAPLPAYNRAFGGSQTPDVLQFMDRIVTPYRPRFVVYYCGSNDVNVGASATAIVGRVREFHERLERDVPGARMFFVSVIRAPDKRKRWPVVDSVNAEMRRYATTAKHFDFIDVNPALADAKGEPRGTLYLPDSLHYRPEAYVLMTGVVKPVLQRAWNSR